MAVIASYVVLDHDHINHTYEVLSWQSSRFPVCHVTWGLPYLIRSLWVMSDSVSTISKGGKGPSEQHALLRTALE